jgi:hypothetical protein
LIIKVICCGFVFYCDHQNNFARNGSFQSLWESTNIYIRKSTAAVRALCEIEAPREETKPLDKNTRLHLVFGCLGV